MNFVETINFLSDFLTVIVSLTAICGIFAAHRHGIFRALHEIGKKAKAKNNA